MRDSLEALNYGFVIYFAIEMVMLIIGLGPMGYVKVPRSTHSPPLTTTQHSLTHHHSPPLTHSLTDQH